MFLLDLYCRLQKEREKEEKQALHRSKIELSKQHYHHRLLSKYGIAPLRNLVLSIRKDEANSQQHYNAVLSRKLFTKWSADTRNLLEEKESKADIKYKEILLKRSFASWKKVRKIIIDLFIFDDGKH